MICQRSCSGNAPHRGMPLKTTPFFKIHASSPSVAFFIRSLFRLGASLCPRHCRRGTWRSYCGRDSSRLPQLPGCLHTDSHARGPSAAPSLATIHPLLQSTAQTLPATPPESNSCLSFLPPKPIAELLDFIRRAKAPQNASGIVIESKLGRELQRPARAAYSGPPSARHTALSASARRCSVSPGRQTTLAPAAMFCRQKTHGFTPPASASGRAAARA